MGPNSKELLRVQISVLSSCVEPGLSLSFYGFTVQELLRVQIPVMSSCVEPGFSLS